MAEHLGAQVGNDALSQGSYEVKPQGAGSGEHRYPATMLRFSVGLEGADTLIADIAQALKD